MAAISTAPHERRGGDSARSEVRIYRVDEPTVKLDGSEGTQRTSSAQVWRLDYPDGAQDAESLAVAPGGAMWIFDKVVFGETEAYAVPRQASSGRVQTLTRVGGFNTVDTGTAGGPNVFGRLTATSASVSADGATLAVRTYTDAYLWRLGSGSVPAALGRDPVHLALPAQPQGEGIAVDGNRLVTDSEKVGSTVYSVPLPALPAAPDRATAAPSTGGSAPASGSSGSSGATSGGASAASGDASASHTGDIVTIVLAGLVVLVGGGLLARRVRRR